MTSHLLTIDEAITDPHLYEPWFRGETWTNWRTILKAAFALPLNAEELAFFRTVAERDPPTAQVSELWIVAGRRAGKDSIASVIAAHVSSMFRPEGRLRPGERAMVMCLAVDRDQSKIVLNFCRNYFTRIPMLKSMIERETALGFELSNSIDVAVSTNSFRSVRGRPILCSILDECAFYMDENSSSPDEETYSALKPGLASLAPSSMMIGISSPYRKAGLLFRKFRDHYGKPSPDVLVIKAPTRLLNPTINQSIIDKALEEDPQAASAEWMGEFRGDIAAFVTHEAVEACTSPGVLERSRVVGMKYSAFCDPSGGASDSMTLAIAHSEAERDSKRSIAVLDAVREIRAPFKPEDAVAEFAALLRQYGVSTVRGDRYAAEWVRQTFQRYNIIYRPADLAKSDLYRDFLPRLNSREVDLLDNARVRTQLLGLERRTARGGRDSIDHAPGAKDDLANAVAGALVYETSARHQVYAGPLIGTYLNGRIEIGVAASRDDTPNDAVKYAPRPRPPEYVNLKNRLTGDVQRFHRTDARQITAQPGSIYEHIKEGTAA